MTQEDAENLLREAGQAADESFPLFDAAVACAVHEDPARDPRHHTLSVVYIAQAVDPDELAAGDDAKGVGVFPLGQWPSPICFDHARILKDYENYLKQINPHAR